MSSSLPWLQTAKKYSTRKCESILVDLQLFSFQTLTSNMKLVFCLGFLFFGACVYAGDSPNVVENEKLSQVFQESNSQIPVPNQNARVVTLPTEADMTNLKAATAKLKAATSELRMAKSKMAPFDLKASAKLTNGCQIYPPYVECLVKLLCWVLDAIISIEPIVESIRCLTFFFWALIAPCNFLLELCALARELKTCGEINCDCL